MAGFSAPIHLLLVLIQFGFCYGLTPGCKSPDSDAAVLSSHALYTVYPSSAGNSPLTVTATLYLTLPAPLSSRPTPLPELRYLRDTENEEWSVLRAAKDSTTLPTASSSFMSTCHHHESSVALPSSLPVATLAQFGLGNLVNSEIAELHGKLEEIQNSLAILMMPNTTSSVATPSSLKQLNANMLPDALASTPTVQDSAIMASSSEQQDASEVTSSLDPTATHDLLALESASPSSPTGSESLHANIIVNSSTLPMIQPPILIVACYSEIYLHNGSCVSPTATELDTFRTELWASKMKTLVVENLLQMCKITPALILIVLQTYGTAQGLEKVMHRNGGLSQELARSISAIVALPLISIGFYVYFGSFHLTWSFVVYVFYIFVTGE
ncbi:hypothetical protein HDK64DRAFT_310888 [Phyllosticta capitalensis]